jgi:hypothetical protein
MIVIDDAFKSPILYYRANERAANPFTKVGSTGIYRHADNALITGSLVTGVRLGWDIASTGKRHQIAPYSLADGDPTTVTSKVNDNDITQAPSNYTNTFCRYIYNANALATSGNVTIRPMNPDTFILISAGKDGVYGTGDDIADFEFNR